MLKHGEQGAGAARHRLQAAFVTLEMALAVALLVGAGLTIRSLLGLWSVDPGLDWHNVLTFNVALPPAIAKKTPSEVRATLDRLTDTIAAVPGVKAVAITDGAFPMHGDNEVGFWAEGQPKPATLQDMPNAQNYIVGPGYLKAMGIPLRRGRFLTAQDTLHSRFVAVIDEDFARRYFPDQDPVGKHVHLSGLDQPFEIVGVVGHVRQWGLDETENSPASIPVQIYAAVAQIPDEYISLLAKAEGFVVRTESANYPSATTLRRAIEEVNADEVAYDFEPMKGLIADSLARRRFSMILLSLFAGLAVFLASIGVYGVASYVVGRRTHEIGIRLALGAGRNHVLHMILYQGAKLALSGVVLGLCLAFGLTRFMASLLFGVTPRDPLTFAAAAILLVGVALAACYIPAREAMCVDPLVALRHE